MRQAAAGFRGELDSQFDRQESEERRELDDWIERNRRSVLEGIADRIAHDRRRVEIGPFLF